MPEPTVSREALLVDGSDSEFRRLVHRMLAFSARLEAVRAGFGRLLGLTGIQYTVLISIAHLSARGASGVSRVAEHLALSGSFVTLIVGQLVRRGLAEKIADPHDRRRVRLSVTDAGRALLARLAPIQREVNDVLFQPLDRRGFLALNELFEAFVRSGSEAVGLVEYLQGAGATGPKPRRARGGQA
jgi:DNA-binding MarR family transcriptional regulator